MLWKHLIGFLLTLIWPLLCWGQWQSTQGPEGGSIRVLFESSDGFIYAGSHELLFRRHQDSISWKVVKGPLGNARILTMGEYKGKLYASVSTNRNTPSLYLKDINQNNWEPLPISNSGSVRAFTFNSLGQVIFADGDRIFITDDGVYAQQIEISHRSSILTMITLQSGGILAGTTIGLFHSEDEGYTWSPITEGLPDTVYISHIHQGPLGEIALLTELGDLYLADNLSSGFVQSMDGIQDETIYTITYDHMGNRYAGGKQSGLFRSAVDSRSWDRLMTPSGLGSESISCMIYTAQDQLIYAHGQSGLYRSEDTGQNWTSDNSGLTATTILAMIPLNEDELLVGTQRTLHRYNFSSQKWIEITFDGNPWSTRCLQFTTDGKLLASSNSGLISLTIEGAEGQLETVGLDSIQVRFIQEDAQGYIYVADWLGNVFRGKINEGWKNISNDEMKESSAQSLTITRANQIYFSTNRDLWKWDNNMMNWQKAAIPEALIKGMIEDDQGNLFAIAYPGVLRSLDGGITWTTHQVSPTRPVYSLISVGQDQLLAGLERDGVYHSRDTGTTWQRFPHELGVSTIYELQKMGDRWIAGTSGGGVYWIDEMTTSVEGDHTIRNTIIFPNPATDLINLKSSTCTSAKHEIRMYDALGRLWDIDFLGSSDQEGIFRINISDLPQGIYFIQIHCENSTGYEKFIKVK